MKSCIYAAVGSYVTGNQTTNFMKSLLLGNVWSGWTDTNAGQRLVVFYTIMAENMTLITHYPNLEPENEFWNWVRVPGSGDTSLDAF